MCKKCKIHKQYTIQNEILECLAGMVCDEIIEEVKKSEQFAVIADETKDLEKNNRFPLY